MLSCGISFPGWGKWDFSLERDTARDVEPKGIRKGVVGACFDLSAAAVQFNIQMEPTRRLSRAIVLLRLAAHLAR